MTSPKLIAGPMATLSHQAFRKCIENFGGCDEYWTEMINAASLLNMGPWEKYYLLNEIASEKIVWQLTDKSEDPIIKSIPIICQKGGIGVDINMGCSAPQIYKTGAGVSWMLKPIEETAHLISEVKKQLNKIETETKKHFRLSVKCRLGRDDFRDEEFLNFIKMLYENGVELVTLHPRTVKEKLKGFPRYNYAKMITDEIPDLKVYLNGEIKDFATAEKALKMCQKADGIMISRQSAVKPWIFYQIKKEFENNQNKILIDRKKIALNFIQDVKENQPKEFYKTRLQRFFSYYCQQFQFGHYFATKMINCSTPEECISQIEDYFLKQSEEQFIEI